SRIDSAVNLNSKDVATCIINIGGCIKFEGTKRPNGSIAIRNLYTIEPDICTVVKPFKFEPDTLAIFTCRKREFFAIPPGHTEIGGVNQLEISAKVGIRVNIILKQPCDDAGGNGDRIPALRYKS